MIGRMRCKNKEPPNCPNIDGPFRVRKGNFVKTTEIVMISDHA
jgi:hypothetical protein